MKPFPVGLDVLLATKVYVFADLYQFALSDGVTFLRYTTADSDVSYLGTTYSSKGPFVESLQSRSRGHWKAGLDVDTWSVTIIPPPADPVTLATYPAKIYNQPWLAAARNGALDGATVDVHRAYWSAWPVRPRGILVPTYVLVDYFAGRVATVQIKRTSAMITINSHMEILQRTMPRNVYQSACRFTLFDTGCTLSAAASKQSGAVAVGGVINNGKFGQTQVTVPANYWTLGRLVWTSGANVGFSAMIRRFDVATGIVTLIAPMPFTVVDGDLFDIYPGCDKTLATCTNTFANAANFGGQPFIPAPETAV